MPRPSRLYVFLSAHWWVAVLLLGVSFMLFGLVSLNLLELVSANFSFLRAHGLDAVREGALLQLAELIVSGYSAALFYLLFKLCERVLVDRVCTARATRPAAPAADSSLAAAAPALPSEMPKAPGAPSVAPPAS